MADASAKPTAAARTALNELSATGEFKRTPAGFRHTISDEDPTFQPEAGRYHLYVSLACPWACRCLAALHLKGLQHVLGVSVTHPTWQRTRPDDPSDTHTGWVFVAPDDPPLSSSTGHGSFGCEDCVPDTVNGARTVRELYERSHDTSGKYSVPVLWDKKNGVIVNNESSEILRLLNAAFNRLATNPGLDLYPPALRPAIDEANAWVYEGINNGVYKCGFATKQEAYEAAFKSLFASLERAEAILGVQRYLAGDALTEADVRLFQTLIRFDEVYVVYFKTWGRAIREFPNLAGYVADLYQTPGMAAAVNMRHIKAHYFSSHPALNAYAIVPVGATGTPFWEQPHDRAARFAAAR